MIAKIDKVYTRRYSDTGLVRTYVEWTDKRGATGRTEGSEASDHMIALLKRARREGVMPTHEEW